MKKSIIILSFVFLLCFTGILYAQDNLKIYFLDVGQGDASIIISPSGQVAIIDSGPDENLILNYLKKPQYFSYRSFNIISRSQRSYYRYG